MLLVVLVLLVLLVVLVVLPLLMKKGLVEGSPLVRERAVHVRESLGRRRRGIPGRKRTELDARKALTRRRMLHVGMFQPLARERRVHIRHRHLIRIRIREVRWSRLRLLRWGYKLLLVPRGGRCGRRSASTLSRKSLSAPLNPDELLSTTVFDVKGFVRRKATGLSTGMYALSELCNYIRCLHHRRYSG